MFSNNNKYSDNYEIIFNNNISFIYFYNFVLFLTNISNKFPKIINEDVYKIDLILIISIFSPDYKASFENGVIDKYDVNYGHLVYLNCLKFHFQLIFHYH